MFIVLPYADDFRTLCRGQGLARLYKCAVTLAGENKLEISESEWLFITSEEKYVPHIWGNLK